MMLIATAGHIDHGKTSLIRALTGVETDRLPEEKARGISIDLGFAYWRPDSGATIGFVDVPGHERFVHNMIAGLNGIGFALLVVATDDGIMPQTREHLQIIRLLGISRGVVALTKIDRVDTARVMLRRGEISALLAGTELAGAEIIPVSCIDGTGVAELAAALLRERSAPVQDHAHGFRLAIDRSFTIAGAGTIVTGTVAAGSAALGDTLILAPQGREVRLRGLQSAGAKREGVGIGERCALNLAGVEVGDVHRGDWLVSAQGFAPTQRIEAEITLPPDAPAPVRHDSRVHLHHGAAHIGARILTPRQRSLAPGARSVVQILLDTPTSMVAGERLILRDQSAHGLLGGGVVLDPSPPTRREPLSQREARVAAWAQSGPAERLAALACAQGIEPDLDRFTESCNLTARALAAIVDSGDFVLAGKRGTIAIAAGRFAAMGDALVAATAGHHKDHPSEGGLPRRAARAALGEVVSAELFASLLQTAVAARRIEEEGALLRLPGHSPGFSPAEMAFWRNALAVLEDRGAKPFVIAELARQLHTSEPTAGAMLQRRRTSGDVWQITPTKYMLRAHVAALVALAAEIDGDVETGAGFTAAQFRDASGLGRNFIIELLEFFDRIGVTRRMGEARHMRGDWEAVVGSASPWRRLA